ncbi:hypothetical protein M9Y10_005451 [Tritrichomonas musculus]|uniref:RRM domain-containing protein n=1 Tax=Tritrichomonas musculus TaxID=1915356 RepID=A0ABR2JLA0_9EUKA
MNEKKSKLPYPPTDHTIFIANLPYNFNSSQLRRFVGQYCKPLFCRVPTSSKGTPKGCGFISLPSREEEDRVMRTLKGKIIGKHPVDLSHASLSKIERYFEEKEVKEAVRIALDESIKKKLYSNDYNSYLVDAALNDSVNKKENLDEKSEKDDDGRRKRKRPRRRRRRSERRSRLRDRESSSREGSSRDGPGRERRYDYESDYDYYSKYDYDDYDRYRKDKRPPAFPPQISAPPMAPISLTNAAYDAAAASIAANTYNQMWSMMQNPALNAQNPQALLSMMTNPAQLYNIMHAHYLQQYATMADQAKNAVAARITQLQAQQLQNPKQSNLQNSSKNDFQILKDQTERAKDHT